jgi:hypothetical protein
MGLLLNSVQHKKGTGAGDAKNLSYPTALSPRKTRKGTFNEESNSTVELMPAVSTLKLLLHYALGSFQTAIELNAR